MSELTLLRRMAAHGSSFSPGRRVAGRRPGQCGQAPRGVRTHAYPIRARPGPGRLQRRRPDVKPLSITCTECPNDRLELAIENEGEVAISAFHREGDPNGPASPTRLSSGSTAPAWSRSIPGWASGSHDEHPPHLPRRPGRAQRYQGLPELQRLRWPPLPRVVARSTGLARGGAHGLVSLVDVDRQPQSRLEFRHRPP